MTIYNLGNIKGEKGDRGECAPGPTGPQGVGIKSIEQITHKKFKFCLTDGSEYIINYDTGSFDGMVVACDKSILSAADGEFATVSAQLTNGGSPVSVSGESVTFEVRKVSDDSLVETLTDTTDSNGLASVEYFGKGVGDLSIKCQCRSVIETYSTIQDCIKCYSGEITSTITPNLTLPSSYQIEYDIIKKANISGSTIRLNIGNNNYKLQTGFDSSGDTNLVVYDGSNMGIITGDALNIWTNVLLNVNGTTRNASITALGDTKSITVNNNINLSNLYQIAAHSSATIRNVKIKPL